MKLDKNIPTLSLFLPRSGVGMISLEVVLDHSIAYYYSQSYHSFPNGKELVCVCVCACHIIIEYIIYINILFIPMKYSYICIQYIYLYQIFKNQCIKMTQDCIIRMLTSIDE